MFTDLVGSVALQQRLGTEAYMRYVERHDELFQQCLALAGNSRILNETGDGFLVRFDDPAEAVNTALRLQHRFHSETWESERIRVRIGLHLGVVTEMDERIRGEKRAVGMPINLTARIMDLAGGGQILMTRAVYEEARNYVRQHPVMSEDATHASLPPLRWMSHGFYEFKGNPEPVEVFEAGAEGIGLLEAPPASAKATPFSDRAAAAGSAPDAPIPFETLEQSDVYLGFSPIDNQPIEPAKEGWVSQFHRNLEIRLQQLSGEPLRIWRGNWRADQDEPDERVVRRLPALRAMVSVVSPPFLKSQRCKREVEAFLQDPASSRQVLPERVLRLVKAVKRPVPSSEAPHPLDVVLGEGSGVDFFDRDPETGKVREFENAFGERARQRYQERIYDLAHELCSVLQNASEPGQDGAQRGRRIFLALATYELRDAYDSIRRVLLEKGHTVLPDRPLPMEAAALEHDVRACLQECDLAIHLLGSSYGTIPENADRSVAELQNQIAGAEARARGFPRLVWIPRQVDVRDERQHRFLNQLQEELTDQGVDIVQGTVSLFKEILARRLNPAPAGGDPAASSKAGVRRVYLICDNDDEPAVELLEDYFFEQGLEVSLPDFEADQDEISRNHRDNLVECDAVLVYFGSARKAWVETKLRDVLKANGYGRSQPLRHQAVYVAPPHDHRKERFRTHSALVLRQPGERFVPTPELDEFIRSIALGAPSNA